MKNIAETKEHRVVLIMRLAENALGGTNICRRLDRIEVNRTADMYSFATAQMLRWGRRHFKHAEIDRDREPFRRK